MLALSGACSCGDNQGRTVNATVASSAAPAKGQLHFQNLEGNLGQNTNKVKVVEMVSYVAGKFMDAGRPDTACVVKAKEGAGNPVEEGVPDEYSIKFTDDVKTINIGCCDARLINEGDLNYDGIEELSVFQYPENGNTCTFHTFTNNHGAWKELFEPFLVPAAGEPVSDSELQQKVVCENGIIYYFDLVDSNDAFIPVKTKAVLK